MMLFYLLLFFADAAISLPPFSFIAIIIFAITLMIYLLRHAAIDADDAIFDALLIFFSFDAIACYYFSFII